MSRLHPDISSESLGAGPRHQRKREAGGIAWSSCRWVRVPALRGTLGSSTRLLEMQGVLGKGVESA